MSPKQIDTLNHDINKWDQKHAELAGEKKKSWWRFRKAEPPVKLYGPYDQTKIELDATYQYMKENIASCI